MFGPKLEARSYTTLLLVVIAVLLALNLSAQRTGQESYDIRQADPSAAVAASTSQVAEANRQIAGALNEVAAAIRGIKHLQVTVILPKEDETGTAAPGTSEEDLGIIPTPQGTLRL